MGHPNGATGPVLRAPQAPAREEANNCGNRSGRRDPWEALRGLWRFSSLTRQRKCRCVPTADLVAIEKRALRANYSGLQTCGSVWTCPLCAPKVGAERAADIAAAISAHCATGGSWAFVTLTMRHTSAQRLTELLDGLTGAWAAIRQDKRTRGLLDAHTVGWIKRLDLTEGANGWHPHLHVLVALRPGAGEAEAEAIADGMFRPWQARLGKLGLGTPTEAHGVDVKVLDLRQAHEAVAAYVAATEYAAAVKPTGDAMGAALELANGNGKTARNGNRTPMQLLADVVGYGLARDHARWREYEQATRGRRQMSWSNGLRRRLIPELGPEVSDEDAAASDDGRGRLIALVGKETWRRVRSRPEGPAIVLEWAEVHDDDDQARDLLRSCFAAFGLGELHEPGYDLKRGSKPARGGGPDRLS